jgi:hypothetical protein
MAQLDFEDNGFKTIPVELIRAAATAEGFINVHLSYWQRYGGQWGLCTYRDAYDFLASDLSEHGLPVRWKSYQSFATVRSRRA